MAKSIFRRGQSGRLITSSLYKTSNYANVHTLAAAFFEPASAGAVYTLTCQSGSYTVSGQSANILRHRNLSANSGSYSVNGQSVSILRHRRLTANAGAYVLNGQPVSIVWTPSAGVVWPSPSTVLLGIPYGPTGTEYTGTLDLGKKFRLDISTGGVVMILDGKKVISV